MIYLRDEGERLRNGFNFYRLSDEYNAGFIFKLGSKTFWFRYGKISKIWVIG